MKYQLSKILLILAALAFPSMAQAGSILVLKSNPPKIEVIGTKIKAVKVLGTPSKATSLKPLSTAKPVTPVAMKKLDKLVKKTAKIKPVLDFSNTQLRASDIDLPVVQTSGTDVDMTASN